jgi:peptidyl-prolyl cis-trans isomerase SurA
VQIRRLTAAAAAGLALLGLAGCRTAPNVAAYVGDTRVSVAQLQSAVDDRVADPAIEKYASNDPEAYTRQVLGEMVQDEVHAVAARRYGVEVTSSDVRGRLDQIFAGQDQDQAYASLASQGLSRQDAFSVIRQQLIRLAIAEKQGLDDPLSDAALRERYQKTTTDSSQIEFGYITVPDQKTADQVIGSLQADPSRYAELAQRFAGKYTLAATQAFPPDQIPGPLAQQAATAQPGTAFSVPVEETGGIVVGFVGPAPTYEQLLPQLRQEAEAEVDKAAAPLVEKVRKDLDVVVTPRYGQLQDDGQIKPADGGVVDILKG